MAPLEFSANEILATLEPEKLFSGPDTETIKREYHKLAMKWHQDVCKDPKAPDVLIQLNLLKGLADKRIEEGIWNIPGQLNLKVKNWGKKPAASGKAALIVNFSKHHVFALGDFYICENSIVYLVNPGNDDLINKFLLSISGFTFATDRMKEEMSKYLPEVATVMHNGVIELMDGRKVVVIKKNPDQVLLRDLINFMPNLDPKHMAWVISNLLNIACYLEYRGMTLNDISLDTTYIAPAFHTAAILGGWWYAAEAGKKLVAVPRRTLGLLPPKVIATKMASRRTDLELIRATAREMFGDTTGFGNIGRIPKPLLDWARYPSTGSAKKDYALWLNKVLPAAFGKRSFTPLNVDIGQINKES